MEGVREEIHTFKTWTLFRVKKKNLAKRVKRLLSSTTIIISSAMSSLPSAEESTYLEVRSKNIEFLHQAVHLSVLLHKKRYWEDWWVLLGTSYICNNESLVQRVSYSSENTAITLRQNILGTTMCNDNAFPINFH